MNGIAQSGVVLASADQALTRLTQLVRVGSVEVRLAAVEERPAPRRGTWKSGRATGAVVITADAVGTALCQVQVAVCEPAQRWRALRWNVLRRTAVAAALAAEMSRQIERRPAPAPAARRHPSHRVPRLLLPAAGAAVVAALALVGQLLAPPRPVTLQAATQRYRHAVEATAPDAGRADTAEAGPAANPRVDRRSHSRSAANHRKPATPARGPAATATAKAAARPEQAVNTAIARDDASAREGRRQRTANATTSNVVPPEGVYRYHTDGWEEIDVPGGHRKFPSESTQTVTHIRCGHRVRWDPMEERWDETDLCVRDGMPRPAAFTTHRSFYGRTVEQHFECRDARAPKGAAWAITCRSDDSSMVTTAWPLGTRTFDVKGEPVEAQGLRVNSKISGATNGTRRGKMWHAVANGVLVHTEVESALESNGPFGRVSYREHYTLHLAEARAYR